VENSRGETIEARAATLGGPFRNGIADYPLVVGYCSLIGVRLDIEVR
jgi:hypothetical protein